MMGKSNWDGSAAQDRKSGTPSLFWIILSFIFFWPLGCVLLGLRIKNELSPKTNNTQTAAPTAAPSKQRRAVHSPFIKDPLKEKKWKRRLLKLFGGIFGATGAIALTPLLMSSISTPESLVAIIPVLIYTLGGAAMLGKGISLDRAARRYQKYLAAIGGMVSVPLRTLAEITGQSERRIADDLDKMIEMGFLGALAYVDRSLGYLFLSRNAAEEKIQDMKSEMQEEETPDGYAGILRNIRRANDRIADDALSLKVTRLEEVTAQIFRAIEEDESKQAQMRTFLEYYLPTTQKLLDSYAEFEAAGIDGDNLRAAKEKIADTMDNIVAGFERQLDALYAADAMDIQADIDVMNTMLRRDNATHQPDFQVTSDGAVLQADGTAVMQETD